MSDSDKCVITFPIVGGIFGVSRLATKLNTLLNAAQISPWHIGQWIDFKHTAIRIRFASGGGWRAPLANSLRPVAPSNERRADRMQQNAWATTIDTNRRTRP